MEDLATVASRALSENSTTESEKSNLECMKAAKLLLGCYRIGDANDPETYIAAIVRVLSVYPIDVVRYVVDPVTGLAGKCKWLPTPAEVKQACDDIYLPRKAIEAYEERSRKQLDDRAKAEALPKPKQTYDEFKAEMAARGLPIDIAGKVHTDTAGAVKTRFAITDAQWDSIPNLPPAHSDYWAGVRHDWIK